MDGYAGKKHPAPAKNTPRATAVRLRFAALKVSRNLQAIGGFATALCSRYAVHCAAKSRRAFFEKSKSQRKKIYLFGFCFDFKLECRNKNQQGNENERPKRQSNSRPNATKI